jgi:SPOR domain
MAKGSQDGATGAPGILDHVSPWRAGGLGGILSSCLQFFGSTLDDFLTAAFSWDVLALKLLAGFLIGLAGFALCGGLTAYFLQAKTQSRWVWFLTAALITSGGGNALPGAGKLFKRFAEITPISTAYAADRLTMAEDAKSCDDIRNITVFDGLKKFLGLDESGYRVVVGSFKRPDDARGLVNKINSESPTLSVFVGDRAPCNDFYPVIVGPYTTTLYEAKKIQTQIIKSVPDAYISNRGR